MKENDSLLQQMFVRATDEVVPPAPWLESRVAAALHRRGREGQRPVASVMFGGIIGSGLRLTAGLVAVLLAVAVVASVLMGTRLLHSPTVPGNGPTVQTPSFVPSPAIRAANWPPGGPVPSELAGAWQSSPTAQTLYLGGYTFQVGDRGPIAQLYFGNVVVNGSEIDFISDFCTRNAAFGFESFTYTVVGNTLVITRASGPGQSNCAIGLPRLAGTYTRVHPSVQSPLPFTPSPAVRAGNWPPGGPVPAQLAGAWKPANYGNVLYLGGYTFESGTDYSVTDYGSICGPGPCQIGNVVVNGSEMDFIQDPCGRAGFGFETFTYTVTGDTLVLTKMLVSGQSNCGLLLAGTYARVS